jgi:4-hydroxy 2-oxovalerate aldolase
MQSVSFLDCTLRDGAHVNSGNFGKNHIVNIINGLTVASADIVEIGFLKNVEYLEDVTSFPRIEDAYQILSDIPTKQDVTYALMARADQYNIDNLSDCNGKIKLIRVAFYYEDLERAVHFAKQVKAKGYGFTMNLINTPGNSLQSLNRFINHANEINPYAVTIVDTFGVLDVESLMVIAEEYNRKLNPNIRIGLHPHENMALAFSLAQEFTKSIGSKRNIIVDGSLMGMGRAPGYLCTELICNYLNDKCGKSIRIPEILKIISNDILPIKRTHRWGYSPEYFLSAKYMVHRSYAEYLSDRDFNLESIDVLLSKIDLEHSSRYDENYLTGLIGKYVEGGTK